MSASKTTTTTTTHDVSTVAGFLAAFDEQVARLAADKGWCRTTHAYEYTGYTEVRPSGGYRVPGPQERGLLPGTIPAEFLTDAGRAWQAEQSAGILAEMREGAKAALIFGLDNEYIRDQASAQTAATALGLGTIGKPTGRVQSVRFPQRLAVATPGDLSDEQQKELANSINAAIVAAVKAAGFSTVRAGDYGHPTASASVYYANRQHQSWQFSE